MRRSGYSTKQCCEIVSSGITGHIRKIGQREKRHRKGKETEKVRRLKKLTGKTSWYKGKKRQTETEKRQATTRKKGQLRGKTKTSSKMSTETRPPSAVMFVERTENGALAGELRQKETVNI